MTLNDRRHGVTSHWYCLVQLSPCAGGGGDRTDRQRDSVERYETVPDVLPLGSLGSANEI